MVSAMVGFLTRLLKFWTMITSNCLQTSPSQQRTLAVATSGMVSVIALVAWNVSVTTEKERESLDGVCQGIRLEIKLVQSNGAAATGKEEPT